MTVMEIDAKRLDVGVAGCEPSHKLRRADIRLAINTEGGQFAFALFCRRIDRHHLRKAGAVSLRTEDAHGKGYSGDCEVRLTRHGRKKYLVLYPSRIAGRTPQLYV